MAPEEESGWGYTQHLEDRSGKTHGERPVLGRDRRIQGSVDYGTYGGPAVVIDPEKYPDEFADLYDRVVALAESRAATEAGVPLERLSERERSSAFRGQVLDAVFAVVDQALRYSVAETNALTAGLPDGTKFALNNYLIEGVGVCRQMALVAGTLLEMLKDDGRIFGEVSIERSQEWNPRKEEYSGHQWVRYTNSAGRVFILDVAQGFRGSLESAGRSAQWNYARPEEREATMRGATIRPPEPERGGLAVS